MPWERGCGKIGRRKRGMTDAYRTGADEKSGEHGADLILFPEVQLTEFFRSIRGRMCGGTGWGWSRRRCRRSGRPAESGTSGHRPTSIWRRTERRMTQVCSSGQTGSLRRNGAETGTGERQKSFRKINCFVTIWHFSFGAVCTIIRSRESLPFPPQARGLRREK